MKIIFVNIYQNINNRGAESFTAELAKRLSNKHRVQILAADKKTIVVQPKHNTEILKRFFLDPASLSIFIFSLKLLPKLLKEKPDVIIPMNGFWQVLICKFLFRKILITGHSGPGWDERWNLYLKPDVFIATTEPTSQWAKKTCPWTKVETIPYGVDIPKFKGSKPLILNLEKPIILCPAAAVEYKRINLAIEAVSQLNQGSLLHLGTGPLISDIKKLGERKLGKRFRSLTVPHNEMPAYYNTSDIVTLPSATQENSPMVFLEAIAAGKFVVTTDTPRSRWILGEAGIYTHPEQIQEYALAISSALSNHNKNKVYEQSKKYSWEKIYQDYERLLISL